MSNTVSFPNLGLSFDINNVAFSVFGLKIYWYGVIIALAVSLAIVFGLLKAKKVGLDSDRVIDVIIVGFISGIIGARLYFVAFKFEDYKDNLLEIFDIRNGGLAIYGGLIFAVAAGLLMCKLRKVKIMPMLDIAALGFFIGQGIGRWANFVNVEAYGSPTTMPWGMSSPSITAELANQYPVPADGTLMVHPTFLYESICCLLGFVFLSLFFKHRRYDGQMFLIYGVWYGTERFFVEGLRTDSLFVGPFRVSQLVSAIIVIVSVAAMIIIGLKRRESKWPLYVDTEESRQILAQKAKRKKSADDEEFDDGGSSDCLEPKESSVNTIGVEEDNYGEEAIETEMEEEDEDGE